MRNSEQDMKTKEEIVTNWLPRYTGQALKDFGEYVLLTNFNSYLEAFCSMEGASIANPNAHMPCATSNGITLIDFGMGSPNAATIMDLLSAIHPKATLFLGKCGGLKHVNKLGDVILPLAAIRCEGTSDQYFPQEVPALPTFNLQRTAAEVTEQAGIDYWTGTVLTTNRRVWEFDEEFKEYLVRIRAMAVDMESATLFSVGFYNSIPCGAVLLVSDQPMIATGIKTHESDRLVSSLYTQRHLGIGIATLKRIAEQGDSIKHLRF